MEVGVGEGIPSLACARAFEMAGSCGPACQGPCPLADSGEAGLRHHENVTTFNMPSASRDRVAADSVDMQVYPTCYLARRSMS